MSETWIVGGVHGAGKSTCCRESIAQRDGRYLTDQEMRQESRQRDGHRDLPRDEIHRILGQRVRECLDGSSSVFERVMSGHFVDRLLVAGTSRGFQIHLVYLDIPDPETVEIAVARPAPTRPHRCRAPRQRRDLTLR